MEILIHFFMLFIAFYTLFTYAVSMLIRYYLKPLDVVRDFSKEPTVSVLLSAFNEGEAVYNTIKSLRYCNYPVNKLEIIAIDDRSPDNTYDWLKKAAKDFPNVIAKQNIANQGKALTMLDAANIASGEYIVGVDSDCIFKDDSIRQLMACFTEKNIGAVGGRVGISNINDSWICGIQAVFYMSSYYLMKTIENLPRKIQCLSGPIVAIKKSLYLSLSNEIKGRTFLGAKITNGEDRALTQMILRKGYDTYVNIDAVCWTTCPTTISQYLKQQLRWRRSAVGQWLEALYNLPTLLRNSSLSSAIFSLAPIYVVLAWNLMLLTSVASGNFLYILVYILIFHMLLGPLFAIGFLIVTRNNKIEKIDSPLNFIFSMVLASFWFPVSGFLLTLMALATLDDGGWVTRQ